MCLNDVVKNTESTIEDILNFFAEEWGGRYVTENLTAVYVHGFDDVAVAVQPCSYSG